MDEIGKFQVESGKLRVSDPCYDKDTWCAGEIKNVKNGEWQACVSYSDEGNWGIRVATLICVHKDHKLGTWDKHPLDDNTWKKQSFEVGVDSGQAGIFDDKYFKDDSVVANLTGKDRLYKNEILCPKEPWYSWCCDRTLAEDSAGVIPFGAVSSSGYGDGCYECYIKEINGEVIGVAVDFGLLNDEEEEVFEEEELEENE